MRKFVHEKKDDWDIYLDTSVFAYNTSRHESTLHTPFEVMFGRKAILPVDLDVEEVDAADLVKEYEDDIHESATSLESLTTQRKNILQKVKSNILEAQTKYKNQYDRKHATPLKFKVGSMVLMKDFRRKKRKGGKMDPKWLGPFSVAKDLGKGFYKLKSMANSTCIMKKVNGAHLKIYQAEGRYIIGSYNYLATCYSDYNY